MKTMNKFNTHRFADVLLWETIINKRKLAIWALIFFGLIAIPQILGLLIDRSNDTVDKTGVIAILLFSAYLFMGTANIFTNIKSKQERINEFMLPATNQEKFVARYLQTVIAMSLAAVIGFFAGDLLQYLLTLAIGQGQQSWATGAIIDFGRGFHHTLWDNCNGLLYFSTLVFCVISLHAFFLFLGSIFHKWPVNMAILTWIAFSSIMLFFIGATSDVLSRTNLSGYVIYIYDFWFNLVIDLLNVAFIAFCFWFAYRKYTRLQVINNRWFNK
jgi:hypothetical protein